MLVSHGSILRGDLDSVASERPGNCVEPMNFSLREEVTTGVVPLGVSDPGGAEEWDSCAEGFVPTLATAVLSERRISTVAVEGSVVACIPSGVLLQSEGELVTGAKLVVHPPGPHHRAHKPWVHQPRSSCQRVTQLGLRAQYSQT